MGPLCGPRCFTTSSSGQATFLCKGLSARPITPSQIQIVGSNDTIVGGDLDVITVSGQNNVVYASESEINYTGSDTSDNSVFGSDDSGSGWGYDGNGSGDDNGDYYGFAGKKSAVTAALSQSVGSIAQYDLSQGNIVGAVESEAALMQDQNVIAAGTENAVLTGSKWDQRVITWSIAGQGGQFSTSMTAAEEAAVSQAFATWAAATGLQFEEVSNAAQSDIQIGLSDLDTASSGVVGLTSVQSHEGELEPGTIIEIEDPTQNALVSGANGQLTYNGTQATFSQTVLHEIGHALGFADNDDPASIMSYYLGGNNQTLDSADVAGAQLLYGSGGSTATTGVNLLVQAAASHDAALSAAMIALTSPTHSSMPSGLAALLASGHL